jgi:hypothetical protein
MKTAVEWLETRAEEREKNNPNESAYWHLKQLQKDFEQAKEMEKEYIVNAHYQGYRPSIGITEISEKYFNETFKSE